MDHFVFDNRELHSDDDAVEEEEDDSHLSDITDEFVNDGSGDDFVDSVPRTASAGIENSAGSLALDDIPYDRDLSRINRKSELSTKLTVDNPSRNPPTTVERARTLFVVEPMSQVGKLQQKRRERGAVRGRGAAAAAETGTGKGRTVGERLSGGERRTRGGRARDRGRGGTKGDKAGLHEVGKDYGSNRRSGATHTEDEYGDLKQKILMVRQPKRIDLEESGGDSSRRHSPREQLNGLAHRSATSNERSTEKRDRLSGPPGAAAGAAAASGDDCSDSIVSVDNRAHRRSKSAEQRKEDLAEFAESAPAISLDDIPYDRDLKWINVPNDQRPKPSMQLSRPMLNQLQAITSGNQSEMEHLDRHYSKMDEKKKAYDQQFTGRAAVAAGGRSSSGGGRDRGRGSEAGGEGAHRDARRTERGGGADAVVDRRERRRGGRGARRGRENDVDRDRDRGGDEEKRQDLDRRVQDTHDSHLDGGEPAADQLQLRGQTEVQGLGEMHIGAIEKGVGLLAPAAADVRPAAHQWGKPSYSAGRAAAAAPQHPPPPPTPPPLHRLADASVYHPSSAFPAASAAHMSGRSVSWMPHPAAMGVRRVRVSQQEGLWPVAPPAPPLQLYPLQLYPTHDAHHNSTRIGIENRYMCTLNTHHLHHHHQQPFHSSSVAVNQPQFTGAPAVPAMWASSDSATAATVSAVVVGREEHHHGTFMRRSTGAHEAQQDQYGELNPNAREWTPSFSLG